MILGPCCSPVPSIRAVLPQILREGRCTGLGVAITRLTCARAPHGVPVAVVAAPSCTSQLCWAGNSPPLFHAAVPQSQCRSLSFPCRQFWPYPHAPRASPFLRRSSAALHASQRSWCPAARIRPRVSRLFTSPAAGVASLTRARWLTRFTWLLVSASCLRASRRVFLPHRPLS